MTNKIGTILFVFKFSFIQVTQQSNINKAKKRVHKTSQNKKKIEQKCHANYKNKNNSNNNE